MRNRLVILVSIFSLLLVVGWSVVYAAPLSQEEAIVEAEVSEEDIVVENLNFPEGPFWSSLDDTLYFVEWGGDKIWSLKDGETKLFLETEAGDGPCGLYQNEDGTFWVCMYSSLKLVKLSSSGEVLQTIDEFKGQPFKGPNDLVVDDQGGVYFTDSGNFEDDWTTGRPAGAVYYLTPEGELGQVDSRLCYPNGIALSLDGQTLFVNEHMKNRVLKYDINPDGTFSDKEVFLELDDECLVEEEFCFELGPDGMTRDSGGNLWIAHYSGGKIVVVSPEGTVLAKLYLSQGLHPTNTVFNQDESILYVTEGGVGLLYQIDLEKYEPEP